MEYFKIHFAATATAGGNTMANRMDKRDINVGALSFRIWDIKNKLKKEEVQLQSNLFFDEINVWRQAHISASVSDIQYFIQDRVW